MNHMQVDHMPAWMKGAMEKMPDWMARWVNHKAMRVMLICMDMMLAWMCVEFGISTLM